ncbi:MAG: corrinoid protein [Coriobacteriales bacterium]|jgi:trimethylamine corrinoid protein|nr:corrinoid protein [Coriobacteriales bacterium]
MAKETIYANLKESIIKMDAAMAVEAANAAMAEGLDPLESIDQGLCAGMAVISDLFDEGELYVPELLAASEAFDSATKILTSKLSDEQKQSVTAGSAIILTVQGDIHDIGKNIVRKMFEANNFKVTDLGRDVSASTVLENAKELKVDLILGSALMTTTMPAQRDIINTLKEDGVRDDFIVIFGGAPVSKEWCEQIGADGYADTATQAVNVAKKLLAKKKEG